VRVIVAHGASLNHRTITAVDEPAENPQSFALLVWGLILLGVALFLLLAAIGEIPMEDAAPPWVLGMVALSLALGGGYAVSAAIAPPGRPWLATTAALVFMTTLSILFTWLAMTGGGETTLSLGPVSFLLPGTVGRIVGRVIAVLVTLLFDALTIFAWVYTLRGALQRSP
jgi:hypothetical protein